MTQIEPTFFERSAVEVARDLIGCYLVRQHGKKVEKYMITETEAYEGPEDKASHASRGRTPRTDIMFGPAGHLYIYFVYGIHWMLNIVTGPKDYPAAVLIRGVRGFSGPARLTKNLKISGNLNKSKLGKATGIWIEGRDIEILDKQIRSAPRIGVDYAGPIWSRKRYRFIYFL